MSDLKINRRAFLGTAAAAPFAVPAALAACASAPAAQQHKGRICKAVGWGMIGGDLSVLDKFKLLKDAGFEGVELQAPGKIDVKEALEAQEKTGIVIHGAVGAKHWKVRLSDKDPAVRAEALEDLKGALEEIHQWGGQGLLLVPGKVTNPETENQDQVWQRAKEQILKAVPLASRLGVRILVENVWNGFCYIHDGPDNQTAEKLAAFIDEIGSPWVNSYFDIGNHQKYGNPPDWIRTLGNRIAKIHVKDWGKKGGFCKIGDGDVDWAAVRKALAEIGYAGWATAEVAGGGLERLQEVSERMDKVLGL